MRKFTKVEKGILEQAQSIMETKGFYGANALTSPQAVTNYLKLHYATQEREVFTVIFLDNKHCVLACEDIFQGTIDGSAIHPREVAKAALRHNATAVIYAHNHPSGNPEPSQADVNITGRLVAALTLLDIRSLDHIVIGDNSFVSFAERGLM